MHAPLAPLAPLAASLQLSPALAAVLRNQSIQEIARGHVATAHGGEVPPVEDAMIRAYVAGLDAGRLVYEGPLECVAAGHLMVFWIELDAEELEIMYDQAHDYGDPDARTAWAAMSAPDREALVREGQALAESVEALWRAHCDVALDVDPSTGAVIPGTGGRDRRS